MPLPANGVPWPPRELSPVHDKYSEWGAWYSGDTDMLQAAYLRTGVNSVRPSVRVSQLQGGFIGYMARFFWGQPNTTNMPKQKLHVPIAGDLCQASGDLLFAEPPTFTVDGNTTVQDRINELVDDGVITTLAETAEIGAAFGDGYLRVTWDKQIRPDGPFFTTVHADAVLPEFRWGKLIAITIWHVVKREGQQVWRHLERHELDAQGFGIILHGLYRGSDTDLGMAIALTEVPETASIQLDDAGTIATETPGLAVVHVPNQRPQRRWRNEPLASNFGRSDLDGIEGLMDALDETYTSWMRDVRLGKARLLVGESALESLGAGKGVSFDTDREVFTGLNLPPSGLASSSNTTAQIAQSVQFGIRYAEHQATADELLAKILRTAGYSTQTFGDSKVTALTATEVQARERRSFMTRDRKIRIWRPALSEAMTKLLAVDKALFGGPGVGDVEVQFTDGVQESIITLANTAQALATAKAASTATLVALVHPDWDEPRINDEVAAIAAEAPKLPDPSQFFPNDGQPAAPPVA